MKHMSGLPLRTCYHNLKRLTCKPLPKKGVSDEHRVSINVNPSRCFHAAV